MIGELLYNVGTDIDLYRKKTREQNMKNHKKNIYLLVLAGALTGACMFFPLQLEGGSTCLFQYTFNVEYDTESNHVFKNNMMQNLHSHRAGSGLDVYLRHYAFIWWGSLGLLVLSLLQLRRCTEN